MTESVSLRDPGGRASLAKNSLTHTVLPQRLARACSGEKSPMWRNYWLALSFANLVYLRAWSDLLPLDPQFLYYRKTLPGLSVYFGIVSAVLALSLLAFAAIQLAPKLPHWIRRVLPVVPIWMVVVAFRTQPFESHVLTLIFKTLGDALYMITGSPRLVLWGATAAAVIPAIWFSSVTVRAIRIAAAAAVPCIAVTFIALPLYAYMQKPLPPDPPLARPLAGTPPVRVIWAIFDEWDQHRTFDHRASGIALPVLDSLSQHSFTATHAVAPLGGMPVYKMQTTDAVPSLLYGRKQTGSRIDDAATRHLFFQSGDPTIFGRDGSIFAQVRAHGWNAAAAGWYLPYCRVFASELTQCYWDVMYQQNNSAAVKFPEAVADETRMLFEWRGNSVLGPTLQSVRHTAEFGTLVNTAERYATDPSLGFIFIHFDVPHVPYTYDPKMGRFAHYHYSDVLYSHALRQVDHAVGDMLSALARAGLDSKTAVILSSDHPFRTAAEPHADPYVPFIVHLPGESACVASDGQFSTLETGKLALAIAGGEVKTPEQVMDFLRTSRAQE